MRIRGLALRPLRSMRARMTLWLASAVALVMLSATAISVLDARRSLENHFAASLDGAARDVSTAIRKGATRNDIEILLADHNEQVAQSGAISDGVRAWLLDENNRIVWQSKPPPPRFRRPGGGRRRGEPPPRPGLGFPFFRPPHRPPPPPPPRDGSGELRGWRSAQLQWGQQRLILALPWQRAANRLQEQAITLFGLVLLATLATAAGAWFLVGKTLAPIDALAAQAHRAAEGGPDAAMPRLQATSPDAEVVRLVNTFNAMLDSLHESALSKERFHASASHELRTPLAGLAGLLSLALSRERSANEYRETLQEAAHQTDRLTRLTRDLLLLNRLQTTASAPPRETVEVADILDLALQRAETLIQTRSLRLEESLGSLDIEATPSHVEILLGNLLENAAKYASEGGTLRVEIESATRCVLIRNDCDQATLDMLERQWERLSEPFFRPDESRHSQTGGNGLGLAICRAICEANGWYLEIDAAPGGGAVQAKVCFND